MGTATAAWRELAGHAARLRPILQLEVTGGMQFLARVEIHNADLQTYYRLHAAMEAESFSRVITGATDFKQYKMPMGTYWSDDFDDSWEALTAAQRAAFP